jgi:DnaK suppressor protein
VIRTESIAADLVSRLRELLGNAGEIARDVGVADDGSGDPPIDRLSDAIWKRLDAPTRAEVVGILQTLSHIQAEQYGICQVCHDPIGPDHLRALPTATVCLVCKTWERGDA